MAAQVGQRVFGSGRFWGTNNTAYSTPTPALVPQDTQFTLKRDVKELMGFNQLPVDLGAGKLSVTGKITYASLNARLVNDMMIGGTLTAGQIRDIDDEVITITTGSTAGAPVNLAGLVADLGIYGATDGLPLAKVSTIAAPVANQYSLTTLGYIFSSLDARTSLKASYLYSTTGGQNILMSNQPMGKIGAFSAVIAWAWGTEKATINLGNCLMTDMDFANKNEDFQRPTASFMAAADASGNLGTMSVAEVN